MPVITLHDPERLRHKVETFLLVKVIKLCFWSTHFRGICEF